MQEANIKQFKDIVKFTIENNLKQPILGIGAPGIGKSEVVKEIADELGYHLEDLRLAQMSEVEIGGLIYPDETKTHTHWLKPDFFPEENGPKTILLLDEITSASKRVQVAAYQLVLDRRIGKHVLPDSTVIIALGNGEEDGGVYVELAAPLADRFEIYSVQCDSDIWISEYASKYVDKRTGLGVNPLVTAFISEHPDKLHTQSENADELVFATPRSWKRVSDTLNASNDKITDVTRLKILGTVGDVVGGEFAAYCERYSASRVVEQILAGEDVSVPSDRADILYITTAIASRINSKLVTDGVNAAVPWYINANKFAEKLPAEYTRSLTSSLPNDPELMNAVQAADNSFISDVADAVASDIQRSADAAGIADFFSGSAAPGEPTNVDDITFW